MSNNGESRPTKGSIPRSLRALQTAEKKKQRNPTRFDPRGATNPPSMLNGNIGKAATNYWQGQQDAKNDGPFGPGQGYNPFFPPIAGAGPEFPHFEGKPPPLPPPDSLKDAFLHEQRIMLATNELVRIHYRNLYPTEQLPPPNFQPKTPTTLDYENNWPLPNATESRSPPSSPTRSSISSNSEDNYRRTRSRSRSPRPMHATPPDLPVREPPQHTSSNTAGPPMNSEGQPNAIPLNTETTPTTVNQTGANSNPVPPPSLVLSDDENDYQSHRDDADAGHDNDSEIGENYEF